MSGQDIFEIMSWAAACIGAVWASVRVFIAAMEAQDARQREFDSEEW